MPASPGNPNPAPAEVFRTTHWSVILAAGGHSGAASEEALARLCRTYWFPLYAFVRRQGHEVHDAQDLTQEFFARFLAKNYLSQVNRDKGKFRSFLLASLKHFLANEWDRVQTRKRGGDYAFTPWHELNEEQQLRLDSLPDLPAEKIYERQWALTLLETVSARLGEECAAAEKVELFGALRIYLSGEKSAASYLDAAARLNMTPGAVQVAVHRLRRRYGELLRNEIAHTVAHPDEIDEEIRHLFSALRE